MSETGGFPTSVIGEDAITFINFFLKLFRIRQPSQNKRILNQTENNKPIQWAAARPLSGVGTSPWPFTDKNRNALGRFSLPLFLLKPLKSLGLEFFIFSLALLTAYLAHSQTFTNYLVSNKNDSDAFKLLQSKNNLNGKFVQIANLSDSDDVNLPRLISLASAASQQNHSETENNDNKKSSTSIVTAMNSSTIVKPNYSVTRGLLAEGNIINYTVTEGDTISTIASRFAVSDKSIYIANQLKEDAIIKPGQELKIPPISGVYYTPQENDTFEGLMAKFKLTEDDIDDLLNANEVETSEDLLSLAQIVIPQEDLTLPKELQRTPVTRLALTTNQRGRLALSTASAPADFAGGSGDFLWPINSRAITQYFRRGHNGIDISCQRQNPGPEIMASDGGFVEIAGWQQGGWGNTVVINHGNGLKSRYAHLATVSVQAGETVERGQSLGRCGSTGRSTGPHLHFTIYKNGVAVNPLSYVK